jgi:hypothetical protein
MAWLITGRTKPAAGTGNGVRRGGSGTTIRGGGVTRANAMLCAPAPLKGGPLARDAMALCEMSRNTATVIAVQRRDKPFTRDTPFPIELHSVFAQR